LLRRQRAVRESQRRVFPNSEQVILVEVNASKKRGDLFLEDLCGFFV
jgi:hypothetical protein